MNSAEFMKWYISTSHASRNKTAVHLFEMEDADVKALQRIRDDLGDDLARHRKRKICIEQLNDGEQLTHW
tara:strand:+ start:367 stop:576 length:210 start_codon:yes stop_codon:yes gene_type:complete